MGYEVRKITYRVRKLGSTTGSSYSGNPFGKSVASQFEADKLATEWVKKKYPGYEIIDLKVEIK